MMNTGKIFLKLLGKTIIAKDLVYLHFRALFGALYTVEILHVCTYEIVSTIIPEGKPAALAAVAELRVDTLDTTFPIYA